MNLNTLLLLLHLLAAILWVGGMFFAHACLRPAAVETLPPPQRLPLMEAALRRFFAYVSVAVAVILVTGLAMLWPVGLRLAPPAWHVMLMLGVVMALVFAYIRLALYPRLRARCAEAAWPQAADLLAGIRRLVALNLGLGVLAAVAAVLGR
jgi:uncharacterized membrane protein